VPAERVRYLAEIADTLRGYHKDGRRTGDLARERQSLKTAKAIFEAVQEVPRTTSMN
jgi:methylmalonyl-CoA mutase